MTTLFRIATLDGWTDVMNVNMYGCRVVQSNYVYSTVDSTMPNNMDLCEEVGPLLMCALNTDIHVISRLIHQHSPYLQFFSLSVMC